LPKCHIRKGLNAENRSKGMVRALISAAVAIAVCLTYLPLLSSGRSFVAYDDEYNFEEQGWELSWAKLRWIWTDGVVLGVYEPVSLMFKWLVFMPSGGVASASAIARAAFILHAGNALGTFWLLCLAFDTLISLSKSPKRGTRNSTLDESERQYVHLTLGAGVSLISCHPLRVEVSALY
jgi:hypothetical protein